MNKALRLDYIDLMRGIAILLVIAGHLIQFNNIKGGSHNAIFEIIYSFHMPLFFAISGYVGGKFEKVSSVKMYFNFLLKKFRALIIPLLFWTLIVRKYVFSSTLETISFNDIYNALVNPGLWFLQVLFLIFVFYGIILLLEHKFTIKSFWKYGVLIFGYFVLLGVLLVVFKIDYLKSFLLYSYAFLLGEFIAKFDKIENIVCNDWVASLCLLVFLVTSGLWAFNGVLIDDVIKIVVSSCVFISFLSASKSPIKETFIASRIIVFGKCSLAIYVIQFYFTNFYIGTIEVSNINNTILAAVIILVSYIIAEIIVAMSKILEKFSVISWLMFGRKIKL